MAEVTGFTAERMLDIEDNTVVDADISSGHLLLIKHNGVVIDVGQVVGPAASIYSGAPTAPISGQMFFDSSNFAGLTDLMASKNPGTSTANWLAYGYGYDTACSFSLAGGGVKITGAGPGSHFCGINLSGLSAGESYFAQLKVQVPTGGPDVQFTVGYKTSGHLMKIKNQDVTLALAFTADGTSAVFGVEFPGYGDVVVKSMSVWVLNQRGYPQYIWDGSGWIETFHIAQKGDIYSRVNTFGDQTIGGNKTFSGNTVHDGTVENNAAVQNDGAVVNNGTTALKGQVTLGDGVNDAWMKVDAPGSKYKGFMLTKAGVARWAAYADSATETGSNAGADFGLSRYDDSGAYLDTPVLVNRATGNVYLPNNLTSAKVINGDQLKYSRTIDISGTNLNSLTTSGFYNGSSMTNAPTAAWWYIEVMVHSNYAGGSYYLVQRATELTSGDPAVFQRTQTAGTWNPWQWVSGGLPAAVGYSASNQAVTATSFTNIGNTSITCPFRTRVRIDLKSWMQISPSTVALDLRIQPFLSGATSSADPWNGNWGNVLYASAVASGQTQYDQHSMSDEVILEAGTTNVGIRAYRVGTGGTTNMNYARVVCTPQKLEAI